MEGSLQYLQLYIIGKSWKKLWSTCLQKSDFEGFHNEEVGVDIVDGIVSTGKSMDLKIDSEDVKLQRRGTTEELVKEQSKEVNVIHEEHQR